MQLYIGNLAPEVDEPLLFDLITQLAPLAGVRMPKHKLKQTTQGYGFAVFHSVKDAEYVQEVLSSSNVKLFGRHIKASPASHSANQNVEKQFVPRIFVGKLDSKTDEESLRTTFEKFGKILEITVHKSSDRKCHAFVQYGSLESTQNAIETLNGQFLSGSKVMLELERK